MSLCVIYGQCGIEECVNKINIELNDQERKLYFALVWRIFNMNTKYSKFTNKIYFYFQNALLTHHPLHFPFNKASKSLFQKL